VQFRFLFFRILVITYVEAKAALSLALFEAHDARSLIFFCSRRHVACFCV
jgi:hypothetical protein